MGISDALNRSISVGRGRLSRGASLWVGAVFFAVFFFLPIAFFYLKAFAGVSAHTDIQQISSILADRGTYRILLFSVGQALLSALLSVLFALPGAYLISHFRFPGRRFFESISLVPFVMPSIIVIVCMISFYGLSGLLNSLLGTRINAIYNFAGILLAHVFYNSALALRIIGAGWERIDPRYAEVAQSLGDRKTAIFRRVTLPLLLPSITTAFVLIFIYCFFSFGIVLVFGGVRFSTFEVKIYEEMYLNLSPVDAGVYAFIQLLFSVVCVILAGWAIERAQPLQASSRAIKPASLRSLAGWKLLPAALYAFVALLFIVGPIATMIGRSFFLNGHPSLEGYRALFVPGATGRDIPGIIRSSIPGVFLRSILLAAVSGTATFLAAFAVALPLKGKGKSRFVAFFQIPIGMSLVTLCLGLSALFYGVIPEVVLVVIAQFFVAFPFVFRTVRTSLETLPDRLVESAESLGASRGFVLRSVYLPVLRRGLLNAYAFSLAIPFADFTAVLTLGRGSIATFPVAIYRLIGFRSFDAALALSVFYILMCLALFLLISRTGEHARESA